eukprot:CAMPEP_0118997052 /NCGR_PEP_ID=MMETSP1173-20130426/61100_1 /TAXON_ID=1034831 /ORGANISM="Rhizochromulina marina cf, Strain CCMP1243" /LENGTH=32 /DNA_ID= /DNA_START= /DNA_END= /DNA_ORIENTATION=
MTTDGGFRGQGVSRRAQHELRQATPQLLGLFA